MSDLIERQKALDAIQQRADRVDSVYSAFWEGLIIAQDIVKNIPSAEPERKKGRWKPFDLTWGRSVYSCTACGKSIDIPAEMRKPIYNYCPNCGSYNGDDER